jgi:hypothetical protein
VDTRRIPIKGLQNHSQKERLKKGRTYNRKKEGVRRPPILKSVHNICILLKGEEFEYPGCNSGSSPCSELAYVSSIPCSPVHLIPVRKFIYPFTHHIF